MRRFLKHRVMVLAALGTLGALFLASCTTTTQPQQFRAFFLPPAKPKPAVERPVVEAPSSGAERFSGELPFLTTVSSSSSLPSLPRPTDAEFIIRRADSFFNSGKKSLQEGDLPTSRREFNHAIETLMAAPEESADRAKIDKRLDEMVEAIYRYDADTHAKSEPESAQPTQAFEKSPKDEILELTFPVDPSLRNKINEQIASTASQLPLEQNDAVLSYINFFSSERGKKILAFGLKQSGRYKAMISRVLAQEGIPQELIFLAQAESAFQPRALSWAKCVGLWQFERNTGARYGLVPGPVVDDRMDPEKATRAAAHHLHDLYTEFGDWYLAMAAYNCGPACVERAVARTGYADYWELRRLNVLPRETKNYVPLIVAMTIVAKNAREYGLEEINEEPPIQYDTIELDSPTHINLVAAILDRPVTELKDLNPALLRMVAPTGYAMHVPKDTLRLVEEAFQTIPADHRDSWRIHRVEAGDTFASLAKKYSTTTVLISSTNQDELPEVGRFALVPTGYPSDRAPVQKKVQARVAPAKPAVTTQHRAQTPARVQATPPKPAAKKPVAAVHKPAPHTPTRRKA